MLGFAAWKCHWDKGCSRPCAALCYCADVGDHSLQNAALVPFVALQQGDSFGDTLSFSCLHAAGGGLTSNMYRCLDRQLYCRIRW